MAKRRASSPVVHDLQCSVCMEIFTQPKLLPCHHTFCLRCLENLVRADQSTFLCPQCRRKVIVPLEGVATFQTNFYIKATDLERARNGTECKIHSNVDLNLYCVDCRQILCVYCGETAHKTHNFRLLVDTLDETKKKIARDRKYLQDAASEISKQMDSKLKDQEFIEIKKKALEEVINNRHALTAAIVDANRNKMLASLDSICQEINKEVTEDVNKTKNMLSKVDQLQGQIRDDVASGNPSRILEAANLRNNLQKDLDNFNKLFEKEIVTRPVLNFSSKSDLLIKQLNNVQKATCSVFRSPATVPEVISQEEFRCGHDKSIDFLSLAANSDGGFWAQCVVQEIDEVAVYSHFRKDQEISIQTTKMEKIGSIKARGTKARFIKSTFEVNERRATFNKSESDSIFKLRTKDKFGDIYQVKVTSEKPLKAENEFLFTLSLSGPQRAFDVDSTQQLFVVLEEARAPDTRRRVRLYRPGQQWAVAYEEEKEERTEEESSTDSDSDLESDSDEEEEDEVVEAVATYTPPSPLCQPSDVCFFTLGGQELLMVADEGTDTIHVVKVERAHPDIFESKWLEETTDRFAFTFLRYLDAGNPKIVQPTALNADSKGRLWVACRGGAILSMTPLAT